MYNYGLTQEELQYLLDKQKEGLENLYNKNFDDVKNNLKEPIERINKIVDNADFQILCPQNIFDSAIFLNCLGKEVHQDDFPPVNFYDFYLLTAAANYNLENYDEAEKYYQKALSLNPASGIARLQLLELNKLNNNYDTYLDDLKDAFYFSYNRAGLAKLYKYTGDYLRHTKDYEMAIVAYFLSTVYDLNDEIANLATETSKEAKISLDDHDWLSEEYMKKFYDKYNIPLMANQRLVELAKAMGQDSYNKKAYQVSKFSYGIAYELTLDEDLKNILDELENKFEHK